ncbi:CD1375 family protein [Paenibacillus sinopodophylli]|nr:CD1375 family protein [Paenibacillus sinopodophylli]
MIPVYCTLIIKGALTFNKVPASSKPAVEDMLTVLGYDTTGAPIAE